MRLIEKKNDTTGVTVDNGALINWASVGGQNGALSGFALSVSSGYLVATKGRLIVQGFTFEVTDANEQLFDLGSYSVDSSEERTLYLKINFDATSRDSSYEYHVDKSSNYKTNTDIQYGITGSYYFPLCTFQKSGADVQNFKSKVKEVVIGGVGGSSSGLNAVPQPLLGVIKSKLGGAGVPSTDGGYIVLANALDFSTLANSYSIKLQLYRRRQNAKYRLTKNGGARYAKKTQWTESQAGSGISWVSWESLTLDSSEVNGSSTPCKGIIASVQTFINRFFKLVSGSGSIVPGTTMTSNVRATGSKKRKRSGVVSWKHNFVEFAYKIYLYNANGQKVGESAISNSIYLAPEKTRENKTVHFTIIANK